MVANTVQGTLKMSTSMQSWKAAVQAETEVLHSVELEMVLTDRELLQDEHGNCLILSHYRRKSR